MCGTISAAAPVTTEEPATAPEAQTPSAVARLDDKDARLAAAIELAHEADPATLAPLFRAVEQMTRSEAGRVLGTIPAFGVAAVPHLVEGLRSRKGFIRQGCALGLGVIGGDDAIEALCDLLIDEPTDIWREVARAIGVLGGLAASALVARVRSKPDSVERAAWALANIQVVSDGARVVESLARGRDPVAANLAQRATELAKQARVEDATVRAQKPSRDVTVNRAFSQRFFEAMGGDAVPTAIPGLSRSAPAVRLDDADLLDARDLEEEEAEQLDESDLIPT